MSPDAALITNADVVGGRMRSKETCRIDEMPCRPTALKPDAHGVPPKVVKFVCHHLDSIFGIFSLHVTYLWA
jgi:hypothetical protein